MVGGWWWVGGGGAWAVLACDFFASSRVCCTRQGSMEGASDGAHGLPHEGGGNKGLGAQKTSAMMRASVAPQSSSEERKAEGPRRLWLSRGPSLLPLPPTNPKVGLDSGCGAEREGRK